MPSNCDEDDGVCDDVDSAGYQKRQVVEVQAISVVLAADEAPAVRPGVEEAVYSFLLHP